MRKKGRIIEQTGFAYAINGQDARTNAGYGTTKAKFQNQRSMGGDFPYVTPSEDVSDIDVDEESLAAVGDKNPSYQPTDIGADAKVQQFYFAAGNTKLSDCIWRPQKILTEIAAYANSMTPFPDMYHGRDMGLGETGSAYPSVAAAGGNFQRTGTTHGWASAPDPIENAQDLEQSSDDDIFTLEDIAKKYFHKNGEETK